MGGLAEGPQRERLESLAIDFENAARHGKAMDRAPEVIRTLGRHMTIAASKEPINSADGLSIAFEATLNQFRSRLSPQAQSRLLEYLVEWMPADLANYEPGSAYFNATVNSFGSDAVFEHITRLPSDPNGQLRIDIGAGYDEPPTTA